MEKFKQFDLLAIDDFEDTEYRFPQHSHTYCEIIYIHKGCGKHYLNANIIPYKAGDLFLVSAEDQHYFEISKSTRFTLIKFTGNYFKTKKHLSPDVYLMTDPEAIMRMKPLKETKLILDEPCRTILKNTVENIVAYNCRKDIASSPIVFYQILSILGLVKEAAAKMEVTLHSGYPDKDTIVSHIHQYIYEPGQIKVKSIAAHFNIAESYFSNYFRKNFGTGYKEFIDNTKIKLIEQRIANGSLSLKQIADEFGFTDESHLSNYFKKKTSRSVRGYKKQAIASVSK